MPITYIHRSNREGYKAGALENGLKTAKGEFVAWWKANATTLHAMPRADIEAKCLTEVAIVAQ